MKPELLLGKQLWKIQRIFYRILLNNAPATLSILIRNQQLTLMQKQTDTMWHIQIKKLPI